MKPKLRLNIETKVQNFKKTNFKNFELYFMSYTTRVYSNALSLHCYCAFQFKILFKENLKSHTFIIFGQIFLKFW